MNGIEKRPKNVSNCQIFSLRSLSLSLSNSLYTLSFPSLSLFMSSHSLSGEEWIKISWTETQILDFELIPICN